jgi:transforming growth factor-beta-induced protein
LSAFRTVDFACGSDDFETLCIAAAGLEDELSGGTYTFFAPTDDAFAELPSQVLQSLLDDAEALAEFLTYHAVAGEAFSVSDLPCIAGNNLITMANSEVTRTLCEDGNPKYQKGKGNTDDRLPEIFITDIEACNGVIHVVDGVFLL